MKTIFIGDIHGRSIWKEIVEQEKPDRVIFIGDYFDSFDIP
ncbi:metallophosphoesterase, partial [bacterium]|nr:metallophosphoesterase [Candidatus Elulimicrobium humile]